MSTIISLMDGSILLDTFQSWLDHYSRIFTTITWTIFIAGVITSLAYLGLGLTNRLTAFVRLILVMLLFSVAPQIANSATSMWGYFYYYALESLAPSMNTASEEFDQLSKDSGALLLAMGGGATATAFRAGSALKIGQKWLANLTNGLSRWLNATIVPAFICAFVMAFVLLLSGLSVILGAGFFSLSVAICLLSPRAGEQWLGRSFGLMGGGLLVVMLAPGIFAGVMDQLVIAPVQNVNAAFADSTETVAVLDSVEAPAEMERIQNLIALKERERQKLARQMSFSGSYNYSQAKVDAVTKLDREIAGLRSRAGIVVEDWTTRSVRYLQETSDKVGGALRNWALRMFVLLLWGLGAVWFLQAGVGVITTVIGGVSMAAAEAIAQPFEGAASALQTPPPSAPSEVRIEQGQMKELTSGSRNSGADRSLPPALSEKAQVTSGERSVTNRKFGQS